MIEFKRLALNKMESDKLIYELTDIYKLNETDDYEEFEMEGYYE